VTQKNIYENHPNDSRVKDMGETSSTVTSRWGTGGGNTPIVSETNALCFKVRGGVSENSGVQGGVPGKSAGKGYLGSEEKSFTIATSPDQWLFEEVKWLPSRVRRLTPVECERLQGFPDNFTNIPYRKKEESPDGPRYKAMGNSMAVPVMAWIGQRIQEVSDIINQQNNVENK
jgi:DNA (cytosine-5)-methyltransferase 1